MTSDFFVRKLYPLGKGGIGFRVNVFYGCVYLYGFVRRHGRSFFLFYLFHFFFFSISIPK